MHSPLPLLLVASLALPVTAGCRAPRETVGQAPAPKSAPAAVTAPASPDTGAPRSGSAGLLFEPYIGQRYPLPQVGGHVVIYRPSARPPAAAPARSGSRGAKAGAQARFEPHVLLLVDPPAGGTRSTVQRWCAASPAERAAMTRLRRFERGRRFTIAFVVTGFPAPPSRAVCLSAHFRLVEPDGTVHDSRAEGLRVRQTAHGVTVVDVEGFAYAVYSELDFPDCVILGPAIPCAMDAGHLPGTYEVQVEVMDHESNTTATAKERFELAPERVP